MLSGISTLRMIALCTMMFFPASVFSSSCRRSCWKVSRPSPMMKSWAPVTGSFHPRHRQHLRQDDLFHYLRQVAVQQVDFRDVARHQFELDSHVEGHFEAVARRKFHCAADAEDFGFLRDVVRRLFPAGGGSLFYRPFQGFQPLLILEIQRLGFQCAECVVALFSRVRAATTLSLEPADMVT